MSTSKEALDADIASAREDMNNSWKDYEICLQERDDDPDLPCDEIKDLYEDDKDLYEELVKRRKAKAS